MKVVCYGDSNTFGYDPRSPFGAPYAPESRWVNIVAVKTGWNVINQGMNGREIPDNFVSISADTDLFVVMLGTNNLLQFWSPDAVCDKMEIFLKSLPISREKIFLIAPPTMKFGEWVQDQELIDDSKSLAKQYGMLASRLGIRYADAGMWNIPLAYDGVHLTEEGHRIFAEKLCQEFDSL